MNKAAVLLSQVVFSLQTEIQLSNLGYLAVISLAHCHSYCSVGTFCSFSLGLPPLTGGVEETD